MAVPGLTINHHNQNKGGHTLKESKFTNYDELPLFLSAKLVAQTLGVGRATAYELMNEKDFPAIRVGNRIVVPKEKFRQWGEQQTGGVN